MFTLIRNKNEVTLNGYSLSVLDRFSTLDKLPGGNYYALPHRSEYRIKLINDHDYRCNAHVHMDGHSVGVWCMKAFEHLIIERPVNAPYKFTFLNDKSSVSRDLAANVGQNERGLIKVRFEPERTPAVYSVYSPIKFFDSDRFDISFNSTNQGMSNKAMNFGSGVTGLGNRSEQRFGRARTTLDIDRDKITTLYCRLVVDKKKSPYLPLDHVEPGYSTEIPEPLGDGFLP